MHQRWAMSGTSTRPAARCPAAEPHARSFFGAIEEFCPGLRRLCGGCFTTSSCQVFSAAGRLQRQQVKVYARAQRPTRNRSITSVLGVAASKIASAPTLHLPYT